MARARLTKKSWVSCPCQKLQVWTAGPNIWSLWGCSCAPTDPRPRRHQRLHICQMKNGWCIVGHRSNKTTVYLFISRIRAFTRSRLGLAPQSALIASIGTELNTIDVITLLVIRSSIVLYQIRELSYYLESSSSSCLSRLSKAKRNRLLTYLDMILPSLMKSS